MQRNVAELMYGWIHATCHQEVNVFLSALCVSYNTCSTWFFASEICRGCLEWSGLCGSTAQRPFLFPCDPQDSVCALYWRAK